MTIRKAPTCACSCNQILQPRKDGTYAKYIRGHNNKKTAYEKSESNNKPHRFKKNNKYGRGRKEGSRNSASLAIDATFDGEAERLTRKCIELALKGNVSCLRTAIERICPIKKSNTIKLEGMPAINDVSSAGEAAKFLLNATINGKLTVADAMTISSVISKVLHSQQLTSIEAELNLLKERLQE